MSVQNAQILPKVYYGLHMVPGVAEYREPEKEPYRILVEEEAIKNMDPSFQGKPVYVRHVDEVNLNKIQEEADGYVVESFYNSFDGKHWCKFIVVSDKGHEAIRSGWKLSNAYIPKEMLGGGLWHGVEYQKEVKNGEYEHLALVPNPRYEESIILTPEQFKEYNSKKELELKRLANSKDQRRDHSMFKFFKKTKVENSAEFEGASVILPKSGIEMTLEQVINELDTVKNMHGYASPEHMVKVGNEEMSVNELVKKHEALMKEQEEKKNKEDSSDKEAKEEEKKGEGELKANEDKKDEKKENEEGDEDSEDKKENSHFEDLKKAPIQALRNTAKIDTSFDQVSRGKSRYGSGK